MPWVRIEDTMPEHPKIIRAARRPLDERALWLHVCGLAYANRHLTDGFIPRAVIPRLTHTARPGRRLRRLVTAGLWTRVEGGYMIHDYLDFQPSRKKILAKRAENARRQAEHRKKRDRRRNRDVTALRENVTPPPRAGPGSSGSSKSSRENSDSDLNSQQHAVARAREEICEILAPTPLHVDPTAVENFIAGHPGIDHLRVAHRAVAWATSPDFRKRNGADVLWDIAARDARRDRHTSEHPADRRIREIQAMRDGLAGEGAA